MADIAKTECVIGGERLTMRDGSQWFHPYSGAAPTLLKVAVETGRLVIVKG